ncbi:MAG: adenosylcobinamide-GDP ribazoletransferase [Burkholderiales bacterium]|nr:adenosylcobinamide-GDP ribazoletransferase [Burkholderiales bacterium]
MDAPRNAIDGFLRHFLAAVQVSTRLPVQGALPGPELQLAAARHFPGVGWLAGIAASGIFAAFSIGLPDGPLTPFAAAVASTIATLLVTGAFYEKSLAAVAGGQLAVTLALLAKVSVLGVLAYRSPGALATALLAAHTVSRFWPIVLTPVSHREMAVAAVWCVVPLALMVVAHGLLFAFMAMLVSGLALAAMRWWLQREALGFTPDTLGAAQQACEIAFYVGAGFGLSSR